MAQQLRLGIAGGGASDFVTSTYAVLTFQRIRQGQGAPLSNRYPVSSLTVAGRSIAGTLATAAPAYATKFAWQIETVLTGTELELAENLAEWNKDNPTTGLRLIDEFQALPSRLVTERTVLSGTQYGVFQVVLLGFGSDTYERIGSTGTTNYYSVRLNLEEH